MVTVGRIVRPHGNRGQVVVVAETDFAEERFSPGAVLYLGGPAGARTIAVTSVRMQDGRPIVGFEGVTSIDDAEALRGRELRIPAEALQALPAGAYYVHDLVGCRVETTKGAAVGTVKDVHRDTGTQVLAVAGPAGEVLVPFVDRICVRVDLDARVVVIEPPDGLLELNAPGAGEVGRGGQS